MIPGARHIPDPEAEAERFAAARAGRPLDAIPSEPVPQVHEWHDVGGWWAEIKISFSPMLPDQPRDWPCRLPPDFGAKVADAIRRNTWT